MSVEHDSPRSVVNTDLVKLPTAPVDSSVSLPGIREDNATISMADEQSNSENSIASWNGWAELENDPLIFGTLLKEWGVPNVTVHEIVPLESVFNYPSDLTYGLIFLSPWAAQEVENSVVEAPEGVWFANQISSFSCATVALMNIINNRANLDLGQRLNDFRSHTMEMSPLERGIALDRFDHIRDVHNSFSTLFDRLVIDSRLKEDLTASEQEKREAAAAARSKRPRKRVKQMEEDEEEIGFHFVAYVPAGGFVWRMDGMEHFPRKLGALSDGVDWIMMVLPELQATWESAATSTLEFSLLSLTATTDSSSEQADEEKMERVREDWGPFIAQMVRLHAEKGDLKDKLT